MSGALEPRKRSPSAAGLFRATGKNRKPRAQRDLVTGEVYKTYDVERVEDDFYPTPVEPTRAFLRAELPRLRQFHTIWEPACGDGAMVREFRAVGLKCWASDLVQRGAADLVIDFFGFGTIRPDVAIVTNPPFNRVNWRDGKGEWIEHAIGRLGVRYMALLLNWGWPGAGGLARIWHEYPPARVYLMRWKIDFTGEGSPPALNAWFVWDGAQPGSDPVLKMLDRAQDGRQEAML